MLNTCLLLLAIHFSTAADPALPRYLVLIENFSGWAEEHWNEKEKCFDAKGAGVSWARGNGDVCLCLALLLTEQPAKTAFSSRKIPSERMLEHLRLTLRTLCLRNKNCTSPAAIKPPTWGGPDWQSALEASRWTWAAYLARDLLDDDTKALVRQVATTEADLAKKEIPQGKSGNTAGDDCVWNASHLAAAAAFYDDDPRAGSWDDWAKRWALNAESRDADRKSGEVVDGKPLSQWLESTNVYDDFTLENHGFWSVPYQAECEEFAAAALAYHVRGKPIPQALLLHAKQDAEILRWITLVDSDLLCPHGQDWAPRDLQHNWAYAWLGTIHDFAWARAAEARALDVLAARQSAFHDGSLHALDFGYETDLAVNWCFSYLLHKHFPKTGELAKSDDLVGVHVFPYVKTAVSRTPSLVSSISWHRRRPAVMIVPNDADSLGEFPSFTDYRPESGLGWIMFQGDKKPRAFHVSRPTQLSQDDGALRVCFTREVPDVVRQEIAYAALPSGEVLLFSRWTAIGDCEVAELVDHPFFWVRIPGYLPERTAKEGDSGVWDIDGMLRMQVIAPGVKGLVRADGLLAAVRDQPWVAKSGDILQDSVCIYQATDPYRSVASVAGNLDQVTVGKWRIIRSNDGMLSLTRP